MRKITCVICDLDGTLLNGFKDVARANHNILAALHAKGVIIGLASGRDLNQIEDNLDRWGLGRRISFIIASNGCEYKNCITGRKVRQGFLKRDILNQLADWLNHIKVAWGVEEDGHMYWNHFTPFSVVGSIADGMSASFNGFYHLKHEKIKKIVLLGPPGRIMEARKSFDFPGLKAVPVGDHSLEIVSADVSKYRGLQRAMEDFPLKEKEVLSFGDDFNDLELISHTHGIAMKNAVEEVVEAAVDTTKYASAQEGLAYHLNSMLLDHNYSFEKPGTEPASTLEAVQS